MVCGVTPFVVVEDLVCSILCEGVHRVNKTVILLVGCFHASGTSSEDFW